MTTTETTLKVKTGVGYGHYDLLTEDGKIVGEVFKVTTTYNIAPRALTVTSWKFHLKGDPTQSSLKYRTRGDALKAATERHRTLA